MEGSSQPDCILCRALGAFYGVGAGTYLVLHAPPQGMKRYGILTVASALGALGLARAFNLPPFGGMFRAFKSEGA
ncbi:hypothetical protein ONE63_006093 [Megalurothrips usitatus]|uniref:DUF4536 domain-containing protein n=1 Tax=Megalurothrips usitatus TaxID=439358 RepID=A0AAV7XWC4_9NEOP|nr:hypothetical protein ONE63_006093 [Megalurothrips usitatus]